METVSSKVIQDGMCEYRLASVLWEVGLDERHFYKSDKEAWEDLRKSLPGKYATLYKKTHMKMKINSPKTLIPIYNKKYSEKLKENATFVDTEVWVPVLFGITDDEYSLV